MVPIELLIKPASGNCNLRCKYCFYADETKKRKTQNYGFMSHQTLETIVKKSLTQASSCNFLFQGGEPTLIGLDFYRDLIKLEQRWNTRGIPVQHSIQTNGIKLDKDWVQFLTKHDFLVGLSLDGTPKTHNRWRIDQLGRGTAESVLNSARLLRENGTKFNIVTVVTAQVAKHIDYIYKFYKENDLRYQQYIPCLDPLGEVWGNHVYSLTPAMYGKFLKKLFDNWYMDLKHGDFVYNRYFENLVGMLQGLPPENCGLSGQCARQLVVEADGSLYPCDFYCIDEYRIGNILTDDFSQIEQNREAVGFIQQSCWIDPRCRTCRWGFLCRGGCRRHREPMKNGHLSLNYFCTAYQDFFAYATPRLIDLAKHGSRV